MRVLVTGASGLIGSALCDTLLARGDEVVGLSRDPDKASQILEAILSLPEVLQAYGVRSVWQLVDRVAAFYLGGAPNSVAGRTLATSGGAILDWLAANAGLWAAIAPADDVLRPAFDAVALDAERWLAVAPAPDFVVSPMPLPSRVHVFP